MKPTTVRTEARTGRHVCCNSDVDNNFILKKGGKRADMN